jgi:hypothetical protein
MNELDSSEALLVNKIYIQKNIYFKPYKHSKYIKFFIKGDNLRDF